MTAEVRTSMALAPLGAALEAFDARAVVFASQVSVRARAEDASALGLPIEPNTWSRIGGLDALWLGPDEWLVTAETMPASDVIADLDERLGSAHRSVIDVSANRVVIDLAGPDRFDLLAAGCGLDLHPRSWRPGSCAQTLLANAPVLLQERDDSTRIFLRPSYAGHLVTWFGRVIA